MATEPIEDELTFDVEASLEIEWAADGRPTTLTGMVAPYNTVGRSRKGLEVILPGAFKKTLAERGRTVPLMSMHTSRSTQPIGKAIDWQDTSKGLFGAFQLARTGPAQDAIALIEDGISTGLSIGGAAINPRPPARHSSGEQVYERHEIKLEHVALVPLATFAEARVVEMLDGDHGKPAVERDRLARRLAAREMLARVRNPGYTQD